MADLQEVAELIDDPDFCIDFTITRVTTGRSTTGLSAGRSVVTHTAPAPVTGVIYPNTKPDSLLVLPEGLRQDQAIHVFARVPMVLGGDESPLQDFINYQGGLWKVAFVKNWSDFGFYHAIAVESGRSDIGTLTP